MDGKKKMALDLFSGTGSTSRVLQKAGFAVTSVDVDPKAQATFCENILDWNYKQFPPGHFSLITASPPCTEFSRAKTVGTRNLELADQLVLKTLEIIRYFQPPRWWLETPRYGLLPNSLIWLDCLFGMWTTVSSVSVGFENQQEFLGVLNWQASR